MHNELGRLGTALGLASSARLFSWCCNLTRVALSEGNGTSKEGLQLSQDAEVRWGVTSSEDGSHWYDNKLSKNICEDHRYIRMV